MRADRLDCKILERFRTKTFEMEKRNVTKCLKCKIGMSHVVWVQIVQ